MTVDARWFYPWLALAGLVLLATAAALAGQAASHGAPPPRPVPSSTGYYPPTGFGGYYWQASSIGQISARWQVPTPTTDRPFATASTWIGLQEAGYGPFIQVGATETAYDLSGRHQSSCALFWSSTQREFHPQELSEIQCGDAVAASMTHGSRGWTLRIDDTTDGTAYAVTVAHSAQMRFTVGEWLQEDPSANLPSGADLPYPTTTAVGFSHLLVDGTMPTLSRSDGTVLASPNGIFQVPTPESDDGFSLAVPQGQALQYLRGANVVDAGANRFSEAVARWSGVSPGQRRTIVTAYIHALRVGNRMMRSLALPPGQSRYLSGLVAQSVRLEEKLSAWQSQGLQLSDRAYREAFDAHDAFLYEDDVTMVRQAVGLPPV